MEPAKEFECQLCTKTFTTKQSLVYHTSRNVCKKKDNNAITSNTNANETIIKELTETFTIDQLKHILEARKKGTIITNDAIETEEKIDIKKELTSDKNGNDKIMSLNFKDDYFDRTLKKFGYDYHETLSYINTIALSKKIVEDDFRFVIKILLSDIPTANLPIKVICLKKNKLQYYQNNQWINDFRGCEVGHIIANNIRRALLIANRYFIKNINDECDEQKKLHLLEIYQFNKLAAHALSLTESVIQLKISKLIASYIYDRTTDKNI